MIHRHPILTGITDPPYPTPTYRVVKMRNPPKCLQLCNQWANIYQNVLGNSSKTANSKNIIVNFMMIYFPPEQAIQYQFHIFISMPYLFNHINYHYQIFTHRTLSSQLSVCSMFSFVCLCDFFYSCIQKFMFCQ